MTESPGIGMNLSNLPLGEMALTPVLFVGD
jgi:hypothetical protein